MEAALILLGAAAAALALAWARERRLRGADADRNRRELAEQRVRREAELREQSQRTSALFDRMVEGLIVVDAGGRIRLANRAAAGLFGFSEMCIRDSLMIAVPLGVATALFLTELAPLRLRQPIVMAIEMLAAVPSVIFGLWGIFVLIPWLRDHLFVWLKHSLGFLPLFQGPIYGVGMLAAGIIIAIMILPIITSISREILRSVPNLQREAAYALGATRWEVLRIAVLSYARRGLFLSLIHIWDAGASSGGGCGRDS